MFFYVVGEDLCFNSSGTYLAAAGSDVRGYLCNQWNGLKVKFSCFAYAIGNEKISISPKCD